MPLLCAGIGLVASCLLIPQVDENRQLLWEVKKLKLDLEQITRQAAANEQLVNRIAGDPAVAERLAQRQMKLIREGTRVLDLKGVNGADELHPFALAGVEPAPPLPPYQPIGGKLAALCREPRTRLHLIGAGLMLMATGVVLGYAQRGRA